MTEMTRWMITYLARNKGKLAAAICFVLAITGTSYSQKPDKKETLSYINKILAPNCEVTMSAEHMQALYKDADGNKIREDRVAFLALDTAAKYEPTEKIVFVRCNGWEEDCVNRTIFRANTRRYYGRISFVIENEADVEPFKKALVHLIRSHSEYKYKNEITFE